MGGEAKVQSKKAQESVTGLSVRHVMRIYAIGSLAT